MLICLPSNGLFTLINCAPLSILILQRFSTLDLLFPFFFIRLNTHAIDLLLLVLRVRSSAGAASHVRLACVTLVLFFAVQRNTRPLGYVWQATLPCILVFSNTCNRRVTWQQPCKHHKYSVLTAWLSSNPDYSTITLAHTAADHFRFSV